MYNPINDRINNLMNQKQMIESQLQNIQQLANIPPININNQITPNMGLNDFNGKWVNNEQEARNMMVNGLPSIMLDRNDIDTILAMSDGRTAINALKTNDTDIEGTEIDDNIALMNSHFRKYIEAKKEYRKDNNEIDKKNSIRELEAFLSAMYGILEEMKTSSDFQEEREMVRDKLREMFSVYQ